MVVGNAEVVVGVVAVLVDGEVEIVAVVEVTVAAR